MPKTRTNKQVSSLDTGTADPNTMASGGTKRFDTYSDDVEWQG